MSDYNFSVQKQLFEIAYQILEDYDHGNSSLNSKEENSVN